MSVQQGAPSSPGYKPSAWYWRVPFVPYNNPPPPTGTIANAPILPSASVNLLNRLTFQWATFLVNLGYARPLEPQDLYKLDEPRMASVWAERFLQAYDSITLATAAHNESIERGELRPGVLTRLRWKLNRNSDEKQRAWQMSNKKKLSMTTVLYKVVHKRFWLAFGLKVAGDTAQIAAPLVTRVLINYVAACNRAENGIGTAPSYGRGIGVSFGLLFLQMFGALAIQYCFHITFSTAILARAGLISAIFSRSMHLSNHSRSVLPNGKLVTLISADVTRVQTMLELGILCFASPIQIIVCLVFLLVYMGPSALGGFGVFVLTMPPLLLVMGTLKKIRMASVSWTDTRVKLIQEILLNMKIVKFFAWEVPFLKRISEARTAEITFIRQLLLVRAAFSSLAFALPAVATVIAIVIYVSGHPAVDPAVVFTGVALFQLLRVPFMLLPQGLAAWVDGKAGLARLEAVFSAETIAETKQIDPLLEVAIRVQDATFVWDVADEEGEKPTTDSEGKSAVDDGNGVFQVRNVNLEIPRGKLVAIVGAVGSGKSSLLQGLVGDMKRLSGSITFGGSVGYCAQTSWIQNASIRENIIFGTPFIEEKYNSAIRSSCLQPDLDMLPSGDQTIVGEKGIQLSGGQKQRISICRALYSSADIILFDDPLSALDAHVGKSIFEDVLLSEGSGLSRKTRVLVTHALHYLPRVDYVYMMEGGSVVESGTYGELIGREGGSFAKLVKDLAPKEEKAGDRSWNVGVGEEDVVEGDDGEDIDNNLGAEARAVAKADVAQLMQAEEREVGGVSGEVYKLYFMAGRGPLVILPFLIVLTCLQCATVMTSYWLVYWNERKFHYGESFYMGVFAGWGLGQALFLFSVNGLFAVFIYGTSKNLHKAAISRVLYAPMSYFDTTPLGRIINRFSKDIDTIDNLLGDAIVLFLSILAQLIAGIAIISVVLPYFLIPGCICLVLFFWAAMWYRPSQREIKRIDAVLRSNLYAGFSESLAGLTTIRAYGGTDRFLKETNNRIDIENRAMWAFEAVRRWLGVRLDVLGTMLTFSAALLVVSKRFELSSSRAGLALSFVLVIQQNTAVMVRQSAEVETHLNSVERILYYAKHVEQEPPHETSEPALKEKTKAESWPAEGRVEFRGVVMAYRKGVEPTLKGVSVSIGAGEKVGIVGRTGAGKSSVMIALYRIADLTQGSIVIDDVDISQIGLADLRSRIAIIPQEAALFSGTLRSNLDPFGQHEDAVLWDAVKRSHLLSRADTEEKEEHADTTEDASERWSLDSKIDTDGGNLSVGQQSLVSLARALVKNSRIIVLDEATASVDYATDKKIQETIAHEFRDRTVLCIAHRLQTIIGYDKIVVMDNGRIIQFGTPVELYGDTDGVFRGMCDRSRLDEDDIKIAAKLRREGLIA